MSVVNIPVWREDGELWHLLIGNESVVQLCFDLGDPDRPWLAMFPNRDPEWTRRYRVDFVQLEDGKAALEAWWYLTQQKPRYKRFVALCDRYRVTQNWSTRKWLS